MRTTADLLDEVDHIDGTPEQVAARLGVTTAAIAKAAYRQGRPDIARTYARVYSQQQRDRRGAAA